MKQCFFVLLQLLVLASDAHTQQVSEQLSNLKSEQLLQLYGRPDRSVSSGGEEQWYYGRSVIFIMDGRVTGWSDAGDLEGRRFRSALQSTNKGREPRISEPGWSNAWVREKQVTPEEVIDDLLVEDAEQKKSPFR